MAHGAPDYSGMKVDVVSRPEWAAKEATDKNFLGTATTQARLGSATVIYAVTSDEALYITQLACAIYATAAADADLNQMGSMRVYDATDGVALFVQGVNGGAGIPFNKSLVIPTGHTVWIQAYNLSNHNCELVISAGGYEK